MSAFTSLAPILLKGVAGVLLVVAVVALLLSNRMSLQLRQKYWSGDRVSGGENERTRLRITILRVCSGVCVVVAVVAWIAMTTLQAYQSA